MPDDRNLSLTYEDLDDVAKRFHPDNPKGHDLAALDTSYARFGFADPVVVNDGDGRLLAGHGRIEALLGLRHRRGEVPPGVRVGPNGEWLVPVVHGVELSADDARSFLIAANRIGELGGWDDERLASLLSELRGAQNGLQGIGFTDTDLSTLLDSLGADASKQWTDPDDVPEEPPEGELYVERSQLWSLDSHRLFCGDATSGKDVERLLGGQQADMSVTDPPFNVSLGRHGGAAASRRRRTIANDALSPSAWGEFVRSWAHQLVSHVDGALYIFMSSREWPTVSRLLDEAGAHWSDTIIWAKDRFVLGRADYQRQYEPIWYGWRRDVRHHWCGDRDQGDVWQVARPAASDLHPTMKPVAVIERAISNSSATGGRVLDLFMGSGTTLIAAERIGRRCLGMELEPKYAQVSIERWQRYTGRKARLERE